MRILQNIVYSKIVQVVAIMVPGQFKTTKPYLWQIQALHEFLQRPCCYIFEAEVDSVSNEKITN